MISQKMQRRPDGDWECLECPYSNKTRQRLQYHIESKHIASPGHVCDICFKVCPTKNALNLHRSRYHKNNAYWFDAHILSCVYKSLKTGYFRWRFKENVWDRWYWRKDWVAVYWLWLQIPFQTIPEAAHSGQTHQDKELQMWCLFTSSTFLNPKCFIWTHEKQTLCCLLTASIKINWPLLIVLSRSVLASFVPDGEGWSLVAVLRVWVPECQEREHVWACWGKAHWVSRLWMLSLRSLLQNILFL